MENIKWVGINYIMANSFFFMIWIVRSSSYKRNLGWIAGNHISFVKNQLMITNNMQLHWFSDIVSTADFIASGNRTQQTTV
jgi:hypothetical protein